MNSHSEQMIDRINLDKEIEKSAELKYRSNDGLLSSYEQDILVSAFINGANYVLNNCKLYTEEEVLKFVFMAYNQRTTDDMVRPTNELIEWFNDKKK